MVSTFDQCVMKVIYSAQTREMEQPRAFLTSVGHCPQTNYFILSIITHLCQYDLISAIISPKIYVTKNGPKINQLSFVLLVPLSPIATYE